MPEKFIETIHNSQSEFGLKLEENQIKKLAGYYDLVQKNNPLLHLVAPCSEEEFAVRHILESLTLLEFLPEKTKFADVGTGAGLPSIPCLLVREDLQGILIESKLKKAVFLQEVVKECGLENRTSIINRQFEEVSKSGASHITCRALDKFTQKLPKLLKWSKGSDLLFFGGNSLRDELQKNRVKFKEKLMPRSEQRYLFIAKS
ncbi:MAG TPA: 16S rRNA (guanine(527)-N(7))-methyltransferase RsmG [Pyrinomonadaceae bacterium]|jgi:16S rRNA (guanine527-N7)-methyltransferase|nr:16S rRNA (guanine(527)-N(7))-methyltransferase RsmG [Pyrinomonadaceae bacterium]